MSPRKAINMNRIHGRTFLFYSHKWLMCECPTVQTPRGAYKNRDGLFMTLGSKNSVGPDEPDDGLGPNSGHDCE